MCSSDLISIYRHYQSWYCQSSHQMSLANILSHPQLGYHQYFERCCCHCPRIQNHRYCLLDSLESMFLSCPSRLDSFLAFPFRCNPLGSCCPRYLLPYILRRYSCREGLVVDFTRRNVCRCNGITRRVGRFLTNF